jgi:hypothetical protein
VDVEAFLDGEGIKNTVTWGLRLADAEWIQLYSYDGGPEGIGSRGTYEVVDDDTVVATDPCGARTHSYELDSEQLTFDMVDDACGPDDHLVQTIIFETAPFTL